MRGFSEIMGNLSRLTHDPATGQFEVESLHHPFSPSPGSEPADAALTQAAPVSAADETGSEGTLR